jgi:hypothetical protein
MTHSRSGLSIMEDALNQNRRQRGLQDVRLGCDQPDESGGPNHSRIHFEPHKTTYKDFNEYVSALESHADRNGWSMESRHFAILYDLPEGVSRIVHTWPDSMTNTYGVLTKNLRRLLQPDRECEQAQLERHIVPQGNKKPNTLHEKWTKDSLIKIQDISAAMIQVMDKRTTGEGPNQPPKPPTRISEPPITILRPHVFQCDHCRRKGHQTAHCWRTHAVIIKTCNHCGREGHTERNCWEHKTCHQCGVNGHIGRQCPGKARGIPTPPVAACDPYENRGQEVRQDRGKQGDYGNCHQYQRQQYNGEQQQVRTPRENQRQQEQ